MTGLLEYFTQNKDIATHHDVETSDIPSFGYRYIKQWKVEAYFSYYFILGTFLPFHWIQNCKIYKNFRYIWYSMSSKPYPDVT